MEPKKIFLFNPTCELAVLNASESYNPPEILRKMERDLSVLPLFMCAPQDVVLASEKPSENFLQLLRPLVKKFPSFFTTEECAVICAETGGEVLLKPWGWSPLAHRQLRELKSFCSEKEKDSSFFNWKASHRDLFARSSSLKVLADVICNAGVGFIGKEQMPRVCESTQEALDVLSEIEGTKVMKSPWSSSGRGLQVVKTKELNRAKSEWLRTTLREQGYVMVEPWLQKRADFTFQFEIDCDGTPVFLGTTRFDTNAFGQYQSSVAGDFRDGLSEELCGFFSDEKIEETVGLLVRALRQSDYCREFRGNLGIDVMVVEENGELLVHPCVEINCRMSMGLLTLYLNRLVAEGSTGRWSFFRAEKGRNFSQFCDENRRKPTVIDGKIVDGFLPLVPCTDEKLFGAYLEVYKK